MSDYFTSMENEFYRIVGQINTKLNNLSNLTPEKKETIIIDSQRELNDAESCVKQMEIEANPLPEAQRREFQQKIRKCRQEFDDTRRKFHKIEDNYTLQKQQDKLMGSRLEDGGSRFAQPDSLLSSQNRRLEEGKRTAYETMDVAVGIQTNLRGQSDVMRRNVGRLHEANDELSWSNKLIDTMNRRIRQNKILMWSVFSVIGLACVGILLSYF